MYKVIKHKKHITYGKTIEITRDDSGSCSTPFQAVNEALRMKRLWKEKTKNKIQFLVYGQILTNSQIESWSNEEYRSLPKCEECGKILSGDVYTHRLCGNHLFCTQRCADKNLDFILEKMSDNEEHEFDL